MLDASLVANLCCQLVMLGASLAYVHGKVDKYCEIEGVCVRTLVHPGCYIQFQYIMLPNSLLMKSVAFHEKNGIIHLNV